VSAVEVTRREGDYELTVDGEVAGHAFIETHGHTVVVTHTEVDDAFQGQGLASRLVRAALDDIRARGEHVIPRCPYTRAWIDKHPDYQDLVASAH
jgi:predicted GNAT family acetyltransferase